MAPALATPEQAPTPTLRRMVGYTSGVYTYATWKMPLPAKYDNIFWGFFYIRSIFITKVFSSVPQQNVRPLTDSSVRQPCIMAPICMEILV